MAVKLYHSVSVYPRVLTSADKFAGTWHHSGWQVAPNRLAPVSNRR
ncbi:MAG: hypothetical protein ACOYJG_01105 [Prevotella sp.]